MSQPRPRLINPHDSPPTRSRRGRRSPVRDGDPFDKKGMPDWLLRYLAPAVDHHRQPTPKCEKIRRFFRRHKSKKGKKGGRKKLRKKTRKRSKR